MLVLVLCGKDIDVGGYTKAMEQLMELLVLEHA